MFNYRLRFFQERSPLTDTLKLTRGYLQLSAAIGDEEAIVERFPCWSVRHALAQLKQTDFQCSRAVLKQIADALAKLNLAHELNDRELEERLLHLPSRQTIPILSYCDCRRATPHSYLTHSRVPVAGPFFELETALIMIDGLACCLEEKISLTKVLLGQSLPTAFSRHQQALAGREACCDGISSSAF